MKKTLKNLTLALLILAVIDTVRNNQKKVTVVELIVYTIVSIPATIYWAIGRFISALYCWTNKVEEKDSRAI